MKQRITFYLLLLALVVLDSVLLTSPNLLGKIGLIIYKYHYLRTFPRAFLTVLLVVAVVNLLCETVRYLAKQNILNRKLALLLLFIFVVAGLGALLKTHLDFSTWTYSHTGIRFRYGAFLLPVLVVISAAYHFFSLMLKRTPASVAPTFQDTAHENTKDNANH